MKDLQDTLKTACQNYSIQESTMELLMASASQIQKRKSSVKSNTESYHPALRTFALTLHLYSAQAYRLVKHSLSSIKRRGEGGLAHTTRLSSIFFNIKDLSATNFWIKSANFFFVCLLTVYKEKMFVIKGMKNLELSQF